MKRLLYLASSLLSACETDLARVELVTARADFPVEITRNAEVLYSDSAILRMRLTAPLMERYGGQKPYLELPEGVKILFYDSLRNVDSRLTADYALRRESDGLMEARRNVVVVNRRGEQLNTEHLVWDEKQAKIYTNEFVRITTPDEVIMGEGMEADQYFSEYRIFRIRGTVKLPKQSD